MLRLSWPKSPLSHAVAQYAVLGSGSICSYVMQAHLCKLSYNSQLSLFPFFFLLVGEFLFACLWFGLGFFFYCFKEAYCCCSREHLICNQRYCHSSHVAYRLYANIQFANSCRDLKPLCPALLKLFIRVPRALIITLSALFVSAP